MTSTAHNSFAIEHGAPSAAKPAAHNRARVVSSCALPKISPTLLRAFTAYSRWYVGRHFHSVRISHAGLPPETDGLPLVIYVNHASWWDPLICLLLQQECFPGRRAFAPIDAAALEQYRFFARLGFFGVQQNSPRGAAQFLRTASGILRHSDTALWLTPQGRFADPRERPVQFKPGLGHLPQRITRAAFVPLALEYTYWEERKPEVLCRFGPATIAGRSAGLLSTENIDWSHHFEQQLAATQDALASEAQQRQPPSFHPLLKTGSGVSLIYDAWRALRAKASGQTFQREHGRL
jgi:1-acyl-sn-glycerol-3-phosphate acyltransferase